MLQEDGWLAGWLVDVSVKENQPTNMMVSYLVIQSVFLLFLYTVIANNFCILAISECVGVTRLLHPSGREKRKTLRNEDGSNLA